MYKEHKRSWTVRTSPELIAYKVPTFSCPSIGIIPKWNGTKAISENLLVANKIVLRSQVLHDASTKIIAMVIIESTRQVISVWHGPSSQPRNEKYFPRYGLRTHNRCDLIYQIMYMYVLTYRRLLRRLNIANRPTNLSFYMTTKVDYQCFRLVMICLNDVLTFVRKKLKATIRPRRSYIKIAGAVPWDRESFRIFSGSCV